jgi:hypothetical protein
MMMTLKEMVEKFQCPGCVGGSDTSCGHSEITEYCCERHVMGTSINAAISFALGLPKGFNRGGLCQSGERIRYHNKMWIQFYPANVSPPTYDYLNIPVWCHEKDGYLFVRCVAPRTGDIITQVIEGGKAEVVCPQAFCVTDKMDCFD